MIKGHAKIELFNAETGEPEKTFEADNLVTNAAKYALAFINRMNRQPSNDIFPLATKALGGLMLFDKELEEDVDNIVFPTEAKLVGYANRSTDTSDSKRGSYNSLESGATDDGYTSVWDFGTSQGNGSILSVCLTSVYAGANPYKYYINCDFREAIGYRNDVHNRTYYPILFYDGYLYLLNGSAIHRAKFNPYQIESVHNGTGFGNLQLEKDVADISDVPFHEARYLFDDGAGLIYAINFHHPDYNTYHGYPLYTTYYPYNNNGNSVTTLSIRTINYGDGSWDVSDENVVEIPSASFSEITLGRVCSCGDYLYWVKSSNASIYIMQLSNPANIQEIAIGDTENGETNIRINESLRPWLTENGVSFVYVYRKNATDYYRAGFIYYDGSVSMSPSTGNRQMNAANQNAYRQIHVSDLVVVGGDEDNLYASDDGYYGSGAEGVHLMAAYLGTINNLGTAIVKNSSQTMKVTYTLTDVKEDSEESEEESES